MPHQFPPGGYHPPPRSIGLLHTDRHAVGNIPPSSPPPCQPFHSVAPSRCPPPSRTDPPDRQTDPLPPTGGGVHVQQHRHPPRLRLRPPGPPRLPGPPPRPPPLPPQVMDKGDDASGRKRKFKGLSSPRLDNCLTSRRLAVSTFYSYALIYSFVTGHTPTENAPRAPDTPRSGETLAGIP